MKKVLTTVLVLTTAFATGCTAVQENPSPLEGARGNALLAQPSANVGTQDNPSQNDEKEEITDTMIRTINHESLPITIHVDATVEKLLDSEAASTIEVKPHLFSQQDVDRIYEVLIGDGYFADVDTQSLDDPEFYSLIEKSLLWDERKIEIVRQEPEKFGGDQEFFKNAEENLNYLRHALKEAQPLEALPAGSKELSSVSDEDGMIYSQIMGFTEKNGDPYRLWIQNDESHTDTFLSYSRFPMGWYYNALKSKNTEAATTPGVDYEKAKIEAQNIADRITGGQMVIATEQGVAIEDIEGYNHIRFSFVRKIKSNAQMTYDSRYLKDFRYNNFDYQSETDHDQEPWHYEKFEICIDDNGVQALNWTYPSEIDGVVDEQVNLLSLDQVMEVFKNMFFVKNDMLESTLAQIYVDEDGNDISGVDRVDINITEIKLGLARVQAGKKYILIPVWDFFGNENVLTPEGEDFDLLFDYTPEERESYKISERTQSKLTINAIDGSIVDRDVGY